MSVQLHIGPEEIFLWWRWRGWGLVKILATMGGWWQKILKLQRLKCSKTVPKNKIWTRKWSLFTNFRFSGRKSQSQRKLAIKITHFTIQFHAIILTQHYKKYAPTTQPKACFPLVSEKHLRCMKTLKNCSLGAFGKQMYVYSCKSPFQRFIPEM